MYSKNLQLRECDRVLAADGRACIPAGLSASGGGAGGGCAATGRWPCASGGCVPTAQVCDGIDHCSDGSDEDLYYCTSRVCPPHTIRCGTGGRCLNEATHCDGRYDCDDGSDEADCDCPPAHFRCASGMCVPAGARCDGITHCADFSDERGCGPLACRALGDAALPCPRAGMAGMTNTDSDADIACYLPAWRCDSHPDCPDAADEHNCGNYTDVRRKSPPKTASLQSREPVVCDEEQFRCASGTSACRRRGAAMGVPTAATDPTRRRRAVSNRLPRRHRAAR
ncbi:hypothetical protein ACJJTC_015850 [Scirpophaga incertulas]